MFDSQTVARRKVREGLLGKAVAAVNDLVLFEQAIKVEQAAWYEVALRQADQLLNDMQDAMHDGHVV